MYDQNPSIPDSALSALNRQVAAEGIVLLENRDQCLPFASGETVSVFGRCQVDTYRSGTGSGGAVNVPYTVTILDGLRANPTITVNEELAAYYEDWIVDHPFDNGGGGWAAEPWFQEEAIVSDQLIDRAADYSAKALVVIGRTAGEDKDYSDSPGSYRLTEPELTMISKVANRFDSVIIVLNTTNIIDLSWLSTIEGNGAIQAILFCWAGGMEGGHALADVLSGDVSPGGRLTDTIAWRLEDYPSAANFGDKEVNIYAEDIYVGYRYFETFAPDAVQYPFGAGLSYATLASRVISWGLVGEETKQVLDLEVTVRNTHSVHSCKEVVQVYCEAPQGKLGKPARVLVCFGKTSTLGPDESETLRLAIPLSSLASYDDSGITGNRSCYVLEEGIYHFYLGGDVRNARCIEATITLENLMVTEQLQEALAPIRNFNRLKPGPQVCNERYEKTWEIVPRRTVDLEGRIRENLPNDITFETTSLLTLKDVRDKSATLEEFVSQLSPADLAALVQGEGMCNPMVTPGTAAAFGGTTDNLCDFGIPVAAASDGPSGIRMDTGQKATQVPIGTLLACTWDTELNRKLFELVGKELAFYKIDTLLGPGINIHRHPLNGRNFEYFSEDPILSGAMAAAQVTGLAQAGVTGTIKHFVANDQETARHHADSVMSERAMREIHLKPFELAVKEGRAKSIMTSYNPVNGHWAASNYDLNTTILREEWGFSGIVMTDWWARVNHPWLAGAHSKDLLQHMIRAQNDLYMVVGNLKKGITEKTDAILSALENGGLTLGELQRSAVSICRFLMSTPAMNRPVVPYDPIRSFIPENSGVAVRPVADELEIDSDTSEVTIKVEENGIYHIGVTTCYHANSQAQSACSLYINGDYACGFSTNGTAGEIVALQGISARLKSGNYRVSFDMVKPGMQLVSLTFRKHNG